MVWSCIIFVLLWVLLRKASATIHPTVIIFFRSVFGILTLMPFFLREGRGAFRTKRIKLHLLRGSTAIVAVYSIFFAVTLVPLADLVAITYAAPIFATIGAVMLLGEKVHLRRVMATLIGFAGVLIVVRPGVQDMTTGLWLALLGTLAIAGSLVSIKALTDTERPETIVAYSLAFILPPSFVVALFFWQWPTGQDYLLLVLIGVLVTIAQTALARAFLHGEATAVLPFDFVRLVLAGFVGWMVFDETMDVWTWVGASVILVSTIYMAHREARLAKIDESGPGHPPGGSGSFG